MRGRRPGPLDEGSHEVRNSPDGAAAQAGPGTVEHSGLARKAQPAGLLERLDVEREQFVGAIDFDQHGKSPRRGRGGDQARAFGQRNDVFGWNAGSAGAEHAIANHPHHRGDRQRRGERRNHHDDPRAGHHLRRRGLGGLVRD